MNWQHLLAYITGTVDQELLVRNEYLVTENRMLRHGLGHMTVALPQVSCYALCGVIQHPLPQEIELHPAIATPLDQL